MSGAARQTPVFTYSAASGVGSCSSDNSAYSPNSVGSCSSDTSAYSQSSVGCRELFVGHQCVLTQQRRMSEVSRRTPFLTHHPAVSEVARQTPVLTHPAVSGAARSDTSAYSPSNVGSSSSDTSAYSLSSVECQPFVGHLCLLTQHLRVSAVRQTPVFTHPAASGVSCSSDTSAYSPSSIGCQLLVGHQVPEAMVCRQRRRGTCATAFCRRLPWTDAKITKLMSVKIHNFFRLTKYIIRN